MTVTSEALSSTESELRLLASRIRIGRILAHATLIVGTAMMIFPIYLAFIASTSSLEQTLAGLPLVPGSHMAENYGRVLLEGVSHLGLPPIGPMLINSFIVAMAITIGKISISIISAFAIVYFRFPFRSF